ncbi:MAG: hypothetical protein GKR89_01770 [Candidatus Latescibacteria bacterium]|nr:hypothetical protein [Candidatus Latescibacterota bacterium]
MPNRFSLTALVLLLASLPAFAGTVEVPGKGDPALYVVKVHADWCGSCKALVPVLQEVKTAVADQPALFVELDVTDEAHTAQSRLLAAALGIEEHLKANNKTGIVLLIKAADKSLVETLNKTNPAAEMATKIKGHIAMEAKMAN